MLSTDRRSRNSATLPRTVVPAMQLLDNIVAPWAPPQRTSGAMDQQRRESIQRMGIPSSCTPAYYSNPPSSSSTPRRHSPFPGGTQSGRRNMSQPLVGDYTVLIYPYSVCVSWFIVHIHFIHSYLPARSGRSGHFWIPSRCSIARLSKSQDAHEPAARFWSLLRCTAYGFSTWISLPTTPHPSLHWDSP